jgi:hypothetical protein
MQRSRVIFLTLLLAAAAVWYLGAPSTIEGRLVRAATDQSVATVFQDHESGRTDALIALIAFTLLTPIAAAVVAVAFILLVKMFEAFLGSLRVPSWFSAPMVGMAAISMLYATSQVWIPTALYACRIAARAYVVYAYGPLPVIR